MLTGLPWWPRGWESAFQCRGCRFQSWLGNQDLTCCGATKPTTSTRQPVCHKLQSPYLDLIYWDIVEQCMLWHMIHLSSRKSKSHILKVILGKTFDHLCTIKAFSGPWKKFQRLKRRHKIHLLWCLVEPGLKAELASTYAIHQTRYFLLQ